ncbi:MAG: nucleotidyltransferase family protein [Pirellulales bacterium]
MSEGSKHFDETSAVAAALRNIAQRLNELQIPYAVAGGMALFKHGFRRFTEDVDILVRKEDLRRIHEALDGRGYLPAHKLSKHLRDATHKVRIEFLTSGDYPGDGKKKPVAFPDPLAVAEEFDSIKYVNLPQLIEMKLASGMTGAGRLKDLSDVLELIKLLNLPESFAQPLNPYVHEKYRELWGQSGRRYVTLWRDQAIAAGLGSIDEMIAAVEQSREILEAMRRDGVTLVSSGNGYARLASNDPDVARKYDMVEESELWQADEGDVPGEP